VTRRDWWWFAVCLVCLVFGWSSRCSLEYEGEPLLQSPCCESESK
jgi:hypothetical protein